MDGAPAPKAGKCPVMHHAPTGSTANQHWWPNQLNLKVLHQQGKTPDPMGADFNYAEAFKALDLDAVKADLHALMTDSQTWWPADYGHYGPFFIRMAWHSAGTYRVGDGRGGAGAGNLRFAPLNSWPDNGNLDKARRLLWPIKAKYGASLSWADLMILTGNVALESMGFETFGYAGGRADIWEPEEDIYWGPETEWLGDDAERYDDPRTLIGALGAVQMGLIYVNPEGPMGNPDPMASAHDVRETFLKMAMNDEETVALVAGGHTFGKAHGAADPGQYVGAEPEGAPLEAMATGWANSFESGKGVHTITSGIEGAWTRNPIVWDNDYFDILLGYEWKLSSSPAGAHQWVPTDAAAADMVPDAHDPARRHAPIMTTADLALRTDPAYREISERFQKDPAAFADAFARAWYKLTHRDMGPYECGLGAHKPSEPQPWQDPVPAVTHPLVSDADVAELKTALLASGLSVQEMTRVAWASASTFRGSDKRGGANGARIRLSPAKDWAVNNPAELSKVLGVLDGIKATFDAKGATKISMADLIVLAGSAAVEKAAKDAGHNVTVPFTPGRTDATQEMTDEHSYSWLEPKSDAMRNYVAAGITRAPAELMVDRAQLLGLNAPELTALVGGMRAIGANWDGSEHGVFTSRKGTLTNDYFVNVLDMGTEWSKAGDTAYAGKDRTTGAAKWTGTAVDLVFGSNSQLRAVAEVYGSSDGEPKLVADFIAAWVKVMNADRFDIA